MLVVLVSRVVFVVDVGYYVEEVNVVVAVGVVVVFVVCIG